MTCEHLELKKCLELIHKLLTWQLQNESERNVMEDLLKPFRQESVLEVQRERYEKEARNFLLNGGAGFEGTPEASTFGFEGAIDCMVSWRMSVEESVRADEETWKAMEELASPASSGERDGRG